MTSTIETAIKSFLREGIKILDVYESKKLLEKYGFPINKTFFVTSLEEAIEISHKLRFPIVLKIVSSNILHKSDIGGVITNIRSVNELREAFTKLNQIKTLHPEIEIKGYLIEEMIEEGYEVVIGGLIDEQFGPVVMFGSGGILVELYGDISFALAPLSRKEAMELIKRTKCYKVLCGYRGYPRADISSLCNLIVNFSLFLEKYEDYIKEIDLNPVFVLRENKGCKIVDARIILR